jgi:hypothetical protein
VHTRRWPAPQAVVNAAAGHSTFITVTALNTPRAKEGNALNVGLAFLLPFRPQQYEFELLAAMRFLAVRQLTSQSVPARQQAYMATFRRAWTRAGWAHSLSSATRGFATTRLPKRTGTGTLQPAPDRMLQALQPFRSARSIGLLDTKELTPALRELRLRAMECVPQRRVYEFVRLASDAARELERLPHVHRLYFSKHVMFIRSPSPVAEVFNEIMAKVFHKACDHSHACQYPLENTSAGYAVSGLRGVGQSQLLRLCTVLAPVLLPNVVSAYVDAAAYMVPDEERRVPKTTLFTMLREAFLARAAEMAEVHGAEFPFVDMTDVNDLICTAAQHGIVSMLCVDELRCVYPSARLWMQLHQMATSSASALFVADSTSRLRAIIRSDADTRSAELTKRWYGVTRPSLNDTKLAEIT